MRTHDRHVNFAVRTLVVAVAALTGVALVGCSSNASNGTGTTIAPAEAADAFCRDLGSAITAVDAYGRVFTDSQLTIAQLRSSASTLEASRDELEASASRLAAAIEAANAASAAAPGTGATTTTVLSSKSADDHVAAINKAQRELDRTLTGVDDTSTLTDAAVEVRAAAFGLEQAYVALFLDADCFTGNAAAAKAANEYTTALQQDLKTLGFYTADVDGLYGPATVEAVKAFQAAVGLPQSGIVDPQSEEALARELAGHAQQEQLNVAALQGALTTLGFYTGPIDGTWSPAVEDALKAYQQDQQLPATGAIDPETLAAFLGQRSTPPTSTTTGSSSSSSTTTNP
jgi:peptidoglycan hydrolase-like protein with peptidoglycan-binding domain